MQTIRSKLTRMKRGVITRTKLYHLAFGFAISAGGGGGSFIKSLKMVETLIKDGFDSIKLHKLRDLKHGSKALMASATGKASGVGNVAELANELLALLNHVEGYYRERDSCLRGILPGEAGPINGILPIYVCFKNKNYFLFDCDAAGRAIPTLTTTAYDFYFNNVTPLAYSYSHGSTRDRKYVVVENLADDSPLTGANGELILSDAVSHQQGIVPFACWQLDHQMVKNGVAFPVNSYRYWQKMGKLLQRSYTNETKLIKFLKILQRKNKYSWHSYRDLLWSTTVADFCYLDHGRWTCGYIVFDKQETTEKRVYFVNENITISEYDSESGNLTTLVTMPSIITIFFYDESPDNAALKPGYIPYNSGDMEKIRALCEDKVKIVVAAVDPTIPGNSNYLFWRNIRSRFLSVITDVSTVLKQQYPKEVFPENILEIIPLPREMKH